MELSIIRTERLELRAATLAMLEAERDHPRLAKLLNATVPVNWPTPMYDADARSHFLSLMREHPEALGWAVWYIFLLENGQKTLIGATGAIGPPSADGTIEIGYSLLDQYQGQGFATEAVGGFLAWAWRHDFLQRIIADTFPHLPASIRVLEKNDFVSCGSGSESGAIRFEQVRPSTQATTDVPEIILETPRLIFREWRSDDWMRFKPIATNPLVIRYVGMGHAPNDEQIQAYIEAARNLYRTQRFCLWPLIYRENQELIGFCGLDRLWGGDEIEIGYWLAPDYWGKGLATEAAQAVMQYGKEKLGLRQIVAVAQPANKASIRVLKKLGMTYVKNALHDGVDHAIYRYSWR